jgi:MATE family multidrug resistance protein
MSVQAETFTGTAVRSRGDVGEVALLAFPVVLQTVAETAMQLIDSAMVGRLGATELGAVGFAGIWIWTLFVPFAGTATGVQVFVSRHSGAKEHERCGPWVWQALWLVVPAMMLWMLAVALFLPALVTFIRPSPALQTAAIHYSLWRLPEGPAVAANLALSAFFRGLSDTRTPLLATVAGILVNIVLAWLLIFGHCGFPACGVAGAGIAISAGSWTMLVVLLVALLQPKLRARYGTRPCAPRREPMLRFLRTSAPIGGQWLLDMTSFAIFGSIVARMGDVSMAASQAMLQLLSLSFMQAIAISLASGAMIGRYLGAGDLDAATRSYRSACLLSFGLTALVAIWLLAMPESLLAIFSHDPRVLKLGRPLLALAAVFQIIDAIGITASGSLRGAGDTRWPFAVQATLAWLLRLPAVYVLAVVLGKGVLGAWIAELIYVSAIAAAFTWRFRTGRWRHMRV